MQRKKTFYDAGSVTKPYLKMVASLLHGGKHAGNERANTGCFTIVETKRQLLKPLSMTLFIFLFPDCHREIVNLSIY